MSQHRSGLVAVASLALLAGCSGASQLSPSAIGAQSVSNPSVAQPMKRPLGASSLTAARLAVLRNSGVKVPHVVVPNRRRSKWGPALFVSDYVGNVVQEFAPKRGGAVIATISDVVGPQGMDTDRHDNLYVTSQGTSAVNVYAPGTYTASKVLNEGNQQAPASVAVCPDDSVYVSNTFANNGYQNGSIQIFAPGATTPTGSIPDSNIFFSFFVSCDHTGNVWYDYLDSNFVTAVAEYVPATGTITEFGSLGIGFPGGIRAFGKNLLSIDDQSVSQANGSVQIFQASNMVAGPIAKISGFADPVSGSWGRSDTATWQADITNQRVEYAKLLGSPQIKYWVGAGVLQGPEDAVVFPVGNR
ncbi:MAG: hypothetical protein WBE83_05325 [Candidatus Cybelea sp.]